MKRIGIINRGEPAIRFLNALDALRREEADAPQSVALYTDADVDSVYVRSADHAIRIGEGRTAYLDAEVVTAALKETACDAAWLGWGFASEASLVMGPSPSDSPGWELRPRGVPAVGILTQ